MFYSCLRTIISSPNSWAVFGYDENLPEGKGASYPPSQDFPAPGTYILLGAGMCRFCQSSALFHMLHHRWWPNFCWFDNSFGSSPPSNYYQHTHKGMSPGLHKTYAHPHTHVLIIVFVQTDHYIARVRHRDPCCLVSGQPVVRGDYRRFEATHIYPRAHDNEAGPSRLFHSHLADIAYLVDPQRFSKLYHRSCTSCRTGRINQD